MKKDNRAKTGMKKFQKKTPPSEKESAIDPLNPMALYEDLSLPGAVTLTEHFRNFSHRHKRFIYAIILISLTGSIFLNAITGARPTPVNLLLAYYDNFANGSNAPLYSIGKYNFSEESLLNQYATLSRYTFGERGAALTMSDSELYANYITDQMETDMLSAAALKENILDSDEAKTVLINALKHAAAEYYIQKKTSGANSDFRIYVSQNEVSDFYKKNKQLYRKIKASENEIKGIIQNSLRDAKREEARQKMFLARKQIIDLIKKDMRFNHSQSDR